MADCYVVGIDLGTTNAVLAYAPLKKGKPQHSPKVLPIGQWVDRGVWQERALFPTYRYHPLPHEQSLVMPLPFAYRPLACDCPVIYGEYAVKLGALNRGQGVCSAKSWLSQASKVHQDASNAFLPWGSNQQASASVALVSPVVASASYLQYLHAWWNHRFPDFPLSEQELVITIPASFDEYARDLTMASAELAGLAHAQFLEEPTAAAYAWLIDKGSNPEALAKAGVMCVLDIGGGTTDLSLIDFRDPNSPKRLAVGDHLMLGGDNLDAAIAQIALRQMQDQVIQASEGSSHKIQVSSSQWSQLMLSARESKEQIMSASPPGSVSLSILGRGKSLIAKQKKTELNTPLLRDQLLEGFLPFLDYDDRAVEPKAKAGLVQVGLQFEQDTAMTGHLLRFLQQSHVSLDSVLLNGGFFNADGFKERIEAQFQRWSQSKWNGKPIVIEQPDQPQLAVALGAAFYASLRQAHKSVDPTPVLAPIIGGGSPRSFFLQLDTENQQLGAPTSVCVAVKGLEEGHLIELPHEFNLVLNQPVQFSLYSTTSAQTYEVGALLDIDPQWLKLPPLQATIHAPGYESNNSEFDSNQQASVDVAPVKLTTEMTMVGSLQLQFKSSMQNLPDTLLEFAGRAGVVGTRVNQKNLPRQWFDVVELIKTVYGPKQKHDKSQQSDKEAMASLKKRIDQVMGPKNQWDVTLCRSMADVLLKWQKNRRRSARHEAFWLSTLGFAMRPGYGVVGDVNRMEHLRKIVEVVPAHHEHSVWFAWWTLVRRVAPGLDAETQHVLFSAHEQKLKAVFDTLKLKQRAGAHDKKKLRDKKGAKKSQPMLSNKAQDLKARAPEAMLRSISSFDKIRNETWFEAALFEIFHADGVGVATPLGVNHQVIAWCFGQVVSRHGCRQNIDFIPLSVNIVEAELQRWLLEDWRSCPELGLAASIAAQRSSESVQVSEPLCSQVEAKLKSSGLPKVWFDSIRATHNKDAFQEALAGERLPQGLGL